MKSIEVALATSAVGPREFPAERLAEIALVGRSNVGKSSLINGLVGRNVARTSATPGKTRLANFYRVAPAGQRAFFLVDLPGYGHAGGGADAARTFERITTGYFVDQGSRIRDRGSRTRGAIAGVILVVDSRHPGVASDLAADAWLLALEVPVVVAATKIDKLSQSERVRAGRELARVFSGPVIAVSAATGEGLGHLWKALLTWIASQPAQRRPISDR